MLIDIELYNKISGMTLTDYKLYIFNNEKEKALIPAEEINSMLEDLVCEVEHWKEKYEDLEDSINNDYDPEVEIPQIHGKGISW